MTTPTPAPNFWQREPALVIGVVVAILSAAASFGLHVSNEQIGGITAAITALMALVGAIVARKVVTSPAAAAENSRQKAEIAGRLSAAQLQTDQARTRQLVAEDHAASAEGLLTMLGGGIRPPDHANPASALHPLAFDPVVPAQEGPS